MDYLFPFTSEINYENVQIKDAIDGLFFIICNGQQQTHKFITIHPTI